MFARGIVELGIYTALCSMVTYCFVLSVITPPGTVPNTPEWAYVEGSDVGAASVLGMAVETKRSGARRNCKWCAKFKPDRCHHCRVCRSCVLKMDHHCPWIYNCVGLQNHKYFMLLLFYSCAALLFSFTTMIESLIAVVAVPDSTGLLELFTVIFGFSLSGILLLVIGSFFGFHIHLMFKGLTTIEYCEMSTKQSTFIGKYGVSPYSKSAAYNMKEVLGSNVLSWFLPVPNTRNDGLHYQVDVDEIEKTIKEKGGSMAVSYDGTKSMALDETAASSTIKQAGDHQESQPLLRPGSQSIQ